LFTRKGTDHGDQRIDIGDFRKLDDDRRKVVVLVLILAVMMRRTRGEIVLGLSVQAKNNLRIDRAVGHGEHRNGPRHLGRDRKPSRGNACFSGEIGLGQQHDVGAANLILEDFRERRLMIEAWVRGALCLDRRQVRRKAAGGDSLRIGKGNDAVDGDA